jgi:hypothetical protein
MTTGGTGQRLLSDISVIHLPIKNLHYDEPRLEELSVRQLLKLGESSESELSIIISNQDLWFQ